MTSDATALVRPDQDGLSRVELRGAFTHPHWLAFLCAGLSAARVSVHSGKAVRETPMVWDAHFLVSGPVEGLDLVGLASTRPLVRDASVPALTTYGVKRSNNELIELSIQAPDSLGFLGRFLSRISLLTLLPSEVEIATRGGVISDRFVLGGIGSSAPSDEVLKALGDMLETMAATSRA